ncbi:glycine receptor subunit alpha-2-like [Portunus trituberculatus]|uniref:glycine receptor subunit alpha-2-like n=1 Tax=Portunus trituberculatus TaxID=210409 RepID=UPI001E1CE5E7|nr:glycine receptor subunit alpha-2-like [Portunus trituberculatus]
MMKLLSTLHLLFLLLPPLLFLLLFLLLLPPPASANHHHHHHHHHNNNNNQTTDTTRYLEDGQVRKKRQVSQEGPQSFLPQNYDKFVLPSPPEGGVLPVSFSIKVRDLHSVDEENMDFTLEWYLRIYWKDYRVNPPNPAQISAKMNDSFPWFNVDPAHTAHLWLPTAYIDHAKAINVPTFLVRPHSLRVTEDKLLRYSLALITTVSCTMDFTAFPLDEQTCYMRLMSYQYRSFEVEYKWGERAVETSPSLATDQFTVSFEADHSARGFYRDANNTQGTFPLVQMQVVLSRKLSYYLLNIYLPSALVVGVSWLTYLVPPRLVPGRMVLTITSLLTLVSMFNAAKAESPKVSYAKAIDVWMLCCITLNFAVLVEYTVVTRLIHLAKVTPRSKVKIQPKVTTSTSQSGQNLRHLSASSSSSSSPASSSSGVGDEVSTRSTGNCKTEEAAGPKWTEVWEGRLETYTPIFLPIVFLLFNIAYWPYFLSKRTYKAT